MNIIIPLGGIGKRFSDNGYTKPKPLIKVLGKEIIFWLLDSLKIKDSDNVYIPYNEYLDVQFDEVVNSIYPNIKLTSLPPTNEHLKPSNFVSIILTLKVRLFY